MIGLLITDVVLIFGEIAELYLNVDLIVNVMVLIVDVILSISQEVIVNLIVLVIQRV